MNNPEGVFFARDFDALSITDQIHGNPKRTFRRRTVPTNATSTKYA